ncbi:MAG: metallophosphoesterase [Pseudomonadota bacterium]
MTQVLSRRRLLMSLGVAASAIATPGFSKTSVRMQGSDRGSLRLLFCTDFHADEQEETAAALAMASDVVNAQKADLVLCGGDLIAGGFSSSLQDTASRWDAYMRMSRTIKAEQHAVLGNHDLVGVRPAETSDILTDPRQAFKERLGLRRTFQSFDALGYRFILLDSIRISKQAHLYDGWVSMEQQEWLTELLASTPKDMPIILMLHMPLLTNFFAATEGAAFQSPRNRVVINNTEVLDLFAPHNLILVLQGHLHVSEAMQWRGTTFLTGGAICGGWWRGAYFDTLEGFTSITLKDDRIEWEYVDYGWNARR